MKKLIFVGGATGSGKTTFVDQIMPLLNNAIRYRRVQGFFDIAEQRGIKREEAMSKVYTEDVDQYFIDKVLENEVVISDVHYAVQKERNILSGSNGSYKSDYVPTISSELLSKLHREEIEIYVLFLKCDSKVIYQRALERYLSGKRELRNNNIEACEYEIHAETNAWVNLCKNNPFVIPIELNSEIYKPEELVNIIFESVNFEDQKISKKYVRK